MRLPHRFFGSKFFAGLTRAAPAVLFVMTLAAGGCSTPRSAAEIAEAKSLNAANLKASEGDPLKFKPAAQTTVVGAVAWISALDSMGVIRLNRDPFPPGVFLIARGSDLTPTGILQTTETVRGRTQGVTLINGVPQAMDEVVEPGPDMAPIIQFNLDANRRREAGAIFDAAGTADPTVVPGM